MIRKFLACLFHGHDWHPIGWHPASHRYSGTWCRRCGAVRRG